MQRKVLITGAGGNLGAAAVRRFIKDGYHVIALVSPGKTPHEESETVEYCEADLQNESDVEAIIAKITRKHPVIDAALLLVGGFESGSIEVANGSSIKRMYSLNFETAYFVARPLFNHMMGQPDGGRIVFIGARPALEAQAGKSLLAYGLSKSLLFKLSEYLNAAGTERNVVSAVIVPATIDTPANRKAMPKADFSAWVTPEAIAEVLAFAANASSPVREPVLKVYGQG